MFENTTANPAPVERGFIPNNIEYGFFALGAVLTFILIMVFRRVLREWNESPPK